MHSWAQARAEGVAAAGARTSLSNKRVVVRGARQSTLCLMHSASSASRAAGVARSSGSLVFMAVSRPSIMGMRLKGGVKSIVTSGLPSPSPSGWYLTW
jgi:hypothetical protein